MAEKTTISSTNQDHLSEINEIYHPFFLRSGDFYKYITTIKKSGFKREIEFKKYFTNKSQELDKHLKKSYISAINAIGNYFLSQPELTKNVTTFYDLQPRSNISKFQICAMAENFSLYSGPGMVLSKDKSIAICLAQKTKVNRYNLEEFEGWNEDDKFYKYHCQVVNRKSTGVTKISKINWDIVNNSLDVALFEERISPIYTFIGIFKANKIYEDKKPYFKLVPKNSEIIFNNDLDDVSEITQTYSEGKKILYKGVRYERNQLARTKCIQAKGTTCMVCGFNFEKVYGSDGKGLIHVHHIIPLNKRPKPYNLDPIKDLIPVCPNCHVMLHELDCAPNKLIQLLNKNKK